MKIFLVYTFAALLAFTLTHSARADECGPQLVAGKNARVCVRENPRSDTVLYFFHSATANETQWEMGGPFSGAVLLQKWARLGLEAPSVISVSFGPTWIFSPAGARAFAASLPALEKKSLRASIRRRWVTGVSMGGLNTGLLALSNPGFFEKAALLCPAASTLSPFASAGEVNDFLRSNGGVKADGVSVYVTLFAPLYGTPESFQRQRLDRLAREAARSSTALYLAYNERDQMGFAGGARELERSGQHFTTEAVAGGHCKDIYTDGLARFFAKP
jgi:pimeloyl-ACP methyl ester carboxylesterase